jgi:hypothetical protein
MQLWPLSNGEHRLLRAVSPAINPLTWLIAGLVAWGARGKVSWGLCALAAAVFAGGFLLSSAMAGRTGRVRRLPHFPGVLDQLIRKSLRELLATLDFYCALVLSLAALFWRIAMPPLPAEAWLAMMLLILLALSSYSQCLFGLEGEAGRSRYKLLPLHGWQVLAAKDAAFLCVALPLTMPLAPLAAIGAVLVVLAMGHAPSVTSRREQTRWRFSTGDSVVFGLGQTALMTMAGAAIYLSSALFLLPCLAAWSVSLWHYGRQFESS